MLIPVKGEEKMSKEKTVKEIDVESLDAELAAARKLEENKFTVFGRIAAVVAFAMSVFHILTVFRQLDVIPQRGIHVAFAFTVLFLSMPLYEHVFKNKYAGNKGFCTVCRVIKECKAHNCIDCIEYDHK